MDTYTHLIRAAEFRDYRTGELGFAKPLMRAVPDDSLTISDRAYFLAAFLLDWQQAGPTEALAHAGQERPFAMKYWMS